MTWWWEVPGLESVVDRLRTARLAHPDFYNVTVPDGCAPEQQYLAQPIGT